ncbi:chromate transporter [Polynucleobacter sp. SHI8]|uniref:chromate efflux transporter n=1 Tax=unclassified Polynucleobacter TaxID=2640945 RepID=UPI002491EAA8|nr:MULTISPECIES: chromate efflux transporter [unclassified Polynucleobacter]BDW11288.1 chromate transporter [Polynucleobacter sp. SHI2]BDW13734.1 chromate transporter [Polynucleobacter sp. SHI8]
MQSSVNASFKEALLFWLKLGFISFGGPAGQIATVHNELVDKKHWISEKRFLHALNYCMILPGPEALQLVIYMGWLLHRTIGGIIAGVLFIFPAMLLLILLSIIYVTFGQSPIIEGIFLGIKPAVTAIVIAAGYRISKKILKKPIHFAIALTAFLGMQFNIPYPIIIIGAGVLGFLVSHIKPEWMNSNNSAHSSKGPTKLTTRALIDDDSEQLPHTHFALKNFLIILFVSFLAFAIPFGALLVSFGSDHVFTQLAWFFTKAALLTFGGAYAVLPYVFQSAVENFQWLTTAQMMDGLALGETTPGPLIIVVTYIGFIASYGHTLLMDSPILAGFFGGLVVSWFTFMPSFCFIFLGGPFIESTRTELRLMPILNGITCAVVGVIANLAIFFAIHTLFPDELNSNVKYEHLIFALSVMVVASIAMIKYGQSILRVLLVSGCLGIAAHYFNVH